MAGLFEPTDEQVKGYQQWVASRPPHVRAVAERFVPWGVYRLKSTGDRVTVYSFGEGEDGAVTLTVNVTGAMNFVLFDRRVFGINPDDLEPCELPAEDEITGTLLTREQVDEHMPTFREMARANRKH